MVHICPLQNFLENKCVKQGKMLISHLFSPLIKSKFFSTDWPIQDLHGNSLFEKGRVRVLVTTAFFEIKETLWEPNLPLQALGRLNFF
jgi:hypothetical protein